MTTSHRRIPTRNQTGWTSNQLNEVSQLFVEYCRTAPLPVLDIGAACGIAALPALAAGATVIANDLDPAHLCEIQKAVPPQDAARLVLMPGRFPRYLRFLGGSLGAVHASNVFHFLTGPQVEQGLESIAHWLAPEGKLFLQVSTPWQEPFREFVPVFETRRKTGVAWPGWMENTREYSTHRKLDQIPASLNLLDDVTLRRACEKAGLVVEDAWLYRRRDLPASLYLDGRECAGLIAHKESAP